MQLALGLPGLPPQLAAALFGPKPANNKPPQQRVWFKVPGKSNRRRRRNYFRALKASSVH